MTKKLIQQMKKLLSCPAYSLDSPNHHIGVDVCEEYASTFRTESYLNFWAHVVACSYIESSIAARLPSYRLFAEHLLDPDQPTITRVLSMTHHPPKVHSLLLNYFTQTANASLLCSQILKDINHMRVKYQSLNTILHFTPINFSTLITHLTKFSNSLNPFASFRSTQSQCFDMLKQLESKRDKVRAKLKLITRLRRGLTLLLMTITSSLIVVVLAHGFVLLVAVPGFVTASIMDMASKRKLARLAAQLDAAAKGTYILSKDFETISQLVARANDELKHMKTNIGFWIERKEDQLFQANGEVARLMKKNQCNFSDQLDELEEHLYLCFMNINRARYLVLKHLLNSSLSKNL
ncbi:UPF0496 protein At3g49070 [Prosopis cineraria]|uniref:UPF0496 protein At3g49070 n=1 Tax=Prosopis cineraria TaxID=364024 RepID=UPI00240F2E92|nr:UPF0496 protein At3g49070 [Prosopis cineraria]